MKVAVAAATDLCGGATIIITRFGLTRGIVNYGGSVMRNRRLSEKQYSRDQQEHMHRIVGERQQLMQLMHEVRGVAI